MKKIICILFAALLIFSALPAGVFADEPVGFIAYNTGNGISSRDKDKIFNRFYRSDESRSKETGGYGLGLSIAKSITDAHSGTITVDGEEGKWVSFTVIL